MSERILFLFLGASSLTYGLYILGRYKSMPRQFAEHIQLGEYPEKYKARYTEAFFRGLFGASGVLLILTGLLFLIRTLSMEPGEIVDQIESYLVGAIIFIAFIGTPMLFIYSYLKDRNRSKTVKKGP
jgi:hypothetical protein